MAVRESHAQPRAAPAPAMAARHAGGRPVHRQIDPPDRFPIRLTVGEHEPLGVETGPGVEPGAALALTVRAVLRDRSFLPRDPAAPEDP